MQHSHDVHTHFLTLNAPALVTDGRRSQEGMEFLVQVAKICLKTITLHGEESDRAI